MRFENISKVYRTRRGEIKALGDFSAHVNQGEFVVVRGPSGSGKTTLLLAAGGMLRPSSGRVYVRGKDIYGMSPGARTRFRARNIGFVFQMFHLVPYLSVLENILLAGGGGVAYSGRAVADRIVERLGLAGRETSKASETSTGERQRAAVARALIGRPRIVLADEPTGNLDPENSREVVRYLGEFHREGGTVLLVTHGEIADEYADRIIHLRDGRIEQSIEP